MGGGLPRPKCSQGREEYGQAVHEAIESGAARGRVTRRGYTRCVTVNDLGGLAIFQAGPGKSRVGLGQARVQKARALQWLLISQAGPGKSRAGQGRHSDSPKGGGGRGAIFYTRLSRLGFSSNDFSIV